MKLIFPFIILNLFTMYSCSSIKNTAIRTTGDIMYSASDVALEEGSWENFEKGVISNLQMMEGLLKLDPRDKNLLAALTKGYTGYSYAVNETNYLKDYYSESNNEFNLKMARVNYTKAIDYGLRYLELSQVSYNELANSVKEKNGIIGLLDRRLIGSNKRDREVVFFLGQAIGALINLDRGNLTLVAQLSVVKKLYDWACSYEEDFNFGTCDLFYGVYESSRPKMLGGNPEKGKGYFQKVIKTHPHNWLARINYLQYYIIPKEDKVSFGEQKFFLDNAERIFKEDSLWHPVRKTSDAFKDKRLRLFQAVALKRFAIIKKYEKDLF
jgi:hypothetical protein